MVSTFRRKISLVSKVALFTSFAAQICSAAIPAARMPAAGWTSDVGVPGGIPVNLTMFCNVRVSIPGSALLAAADGVTDDTAAINAALALCPNGQYVYLPAGTYRCNGSIVRQGVYNYDGIQKHFSVVLRGAGSSLTKILSYSPGDCINFSQGLGPFAGGTFVSGNTRGSTSAVVNVAIASVFEVGKWALVMRDNTEAAAINAASYETNACSQWVKITGISGAGGTRTFTFTPALNEGYASDLFHIPASIPYRCGVEDLYVERMTNTTGHNIHFVYGQECWLKRVESNNARKWHIRLESCAGCEVRQCYVHDAWDAGGDAGYGFGLFQYSCSNLIEDNIAYHCRHSYVTEYGAQNNVIGYNFSKDPINNDHGPGLVNQLITDYMMEDLFHHGGSPRWNLWEGNVGSKIAGDFLLGGADYNTYFRNFIRRKGLPTTVVSLVGSDIQRYNYNVNLVGNVYDTPAVPTQLRRWGSSGDDSSNPDPLSQSTALVDGEYDVAAATTTWDASNPGHTLPNSYYLSAKPKFFGTLPWPAIGPDALASSVITANPAAYRFVNGTPPPTAPYLLGQPSDAQYPVGASATLAVVVEGYPTPAYQWSKGGVPVAGATSAILTITNAAVSDSGAYTCTATNASGVVTTTSATLTVTNAAFITSQAASQTVNQNTTATFTVSANGIPAPTIQWQKNGVALTNAGRISGATGTTLTITGVVGADAGTYTAVATNTLGTSTSTGAVLTVNTIPVFTTHPQSQAVAFGGTATFTALATSSPPPSYQWQKDGVNLPGQTGTTLTIPGVNAGSTGVYTCVAISLAGQTSSNGAGLNTTNSPPAPISQPVTQTVMSGSSVTLTFNVSGTPTPSIQWYKDGVAIPGATGATYTVTASKSNSGTYTASAINSTGTITSSPAYLGVMVPSRLVNVSTRAAAGTGAQTLIAGFVISGGSKSILVRGVGPGIAQYFPAGSTLVDPALNILDGTTSVASNDDWGGTTALKNVFAQVGAFSLSDTSKDSVINSTLPGNKVYSATLSGSGGGLAIAEIYDADTADIPAGRLVNLSTRTQVGTGTGVLIAGFVITGDFPKQVLIRAIGPTLGQYGVPGFLADPQLDLYVAGATTPMLSNDNWGGTAALTTAFNQVGAFALPDGASKDAAILVTLNPGSYSAVVSGVGNTTGVALVEVYDVQ